MCADHPLVSAISENAEKLQCAPQLESSLSSSEGAMATLLTHPVLAQDGRDLGTLVALEPPTHLTRLLTPTPTLGR